MTQFQRSGHKIKLNHSNALPRCILALSVESERETLTISGTLIAHKFKSASVASCRLARGSFISQTNVHFDDRPSLWSYIFEQSRPNYTTWLIGHNVLPALIQCGLPRRFQSGEISIDRPRSKRTREDNDEENTHQAGLAVIESPPAIIGCRVSATQGRIVIVDLLNWFQGSLPSIAAACGIANSQESTVGDSGNSREKPSSVNAAIVLQVFTQLISWVSDNNMGMFRYTASAQAIGAYRHRFMENNIYVHDNTAVQKQERKAYYGGRSEAFKLGVFVEPVFQLDVNALFPSVMSGGHYPNRLTRFEQREELIEPLPAIDWSRSVAEVEIHTDKPFYPLRTDTNVIYPVGTFRTSLCGVELYKAFTTGSIRKCGSWSEYAVAPLFNLWTGTLWQMRLDYRKSGDLLYEQFTKRIMNSLYGKFAQLTPAWVNCSANSQMLPWTTCSHYDCVLNEWTKYRSIGWQVQVNQGRTERPQSFYAIAAFITAAARNRMDWLRRVAGKPHVYYQGVDSLIVNKRGYANLIDAGEVDENALGKLRLEYQSDYGYIRGVSDYQIGSKVVLSSRALNSEVNDQGDVLQHKYYIMQHLFRNGPIDHVEERLEEWHRQQTYKKGQVGEDGWVSPLVLGATPTSASVGVGSDTAAAAANCSNSGL